MVVGVGLRVEGCRLRVRVQFLGNRNDLKGGAWLIAKRRCDDQLEQKVVHLPVES